MSSTKRFEQLLELLIDGESHSGEALATELNISRAAIWKLMNRAKQLGFQIYARTKAGYRMKDKIDLLNVSKIKQHLSVENIKKIKCLEILHSIDSTNDYLLKRLFELSKMPRICLAEQQTAGKGRRGRDWYSPYARNIYLSLLWEFSFDSSQLRGLSIVIGLAVFKALQQYGITKDLYLKWPNDVYYQNKKLAGVLIETRGEFNHNCKAVIGVGVNANMIREDRSIKQPWISLQKITKKTIDRNRLIALIIAQLVQQLDLFSRQGIKPFVKEWQQYDREKTQSN